MYGFYGGNDARVTATTTKSAVLMKQAGKAYEPVVYVGAGLGFLRSGEQPYAGEPNKKARDAAWQRIKQILGNI